MKHAVILICTMLAASVGVAVAPAGELGKASPWTESKAERLVLRTATVSLAMEDREALEGELRRGVSLYQALALEASLNGDPFNEAGVYYEVVYRYSRALRKVRFGLDIDEADCRGSGRAATGRRYTRFRCSVTSELLEIPSATLGEEGRISIEAPQRTVGPIDAQLDVRVTGTSSFVFRKI